MSKVRNMSHLFVMVMTILVSMAQTPISMGVSMGVSMAQTPFRLFISKLTVHIKNDLSSNQQPLKSHCYSADHHDLGEHTLWMTNEFFFTFKTKFFGFSHFWCDFEHGAQVKTVDVYDNEYIGGSRCVDTYHCYWSVRDDGFYFTDVEPPEWSKMTGWTDEE